MLNTINSTALNSATLSSGAESNDSSDLGQEDFLTLMLTQFQNQDPFKPMDNGEFMGQLAQFSTVNGITELQASMETMANTMKSNQAIEASALLGSRVLVKNDIAGFDEQGELSGTIKLPVASQNVTLVLHDGSGNEVHSKALGSQSSGNIPFTIEQSELTDSEAKGPFSIMAMTNDGSDSQSLDVLISSDVTAVSLGDGLGNIELHLAGIGIRRLSDIEEIQSK